MNEITSPLIPSQFPEHLIQDSPLLVEFIKTYYEYADQRDASVGVVQNMHQTRDIDLTDEKYINDFYSQYGDQLPREIAMDRRNFLKILNQIYDAKGTEKSLKLMFQAIFNEKIDVSFPGDQRLRASDGIWVREKYITLETKFGNPPEGIVQLSFSNENGDYSFETTRTEITSASTARFYFQSFTNISFDIAQRVYQFDSEGIMLYAGDLVSSPSYLNIITPGKSWQIGQVIIIPGTESNTVAKVTSIDSTGGITGVQVVEYGSYHADGQLITVSPYPNKPASASVVLDSIITSTDPLTYLHTLSVAEYVSEMSETAIGVIDSITPDSYFLEDYVEQSYTGHLAFAKSVTQVASPGEDTGDLTIEDWLASRATLEFNYEDVVQLRGYYLTESGQLSNQAVKLQDNYFYQAFSYLIETSQDISQYSRILNITHPAGMKRFSTLNKTANLDVIVDVEREISTPVVYISDMSDVQENMSH